MWKPASTADTYARLVRAFGPDQYRRVTFPRRGHLDPVIGRDAHLDVYPALLAHLDRVGHVAHTQRPPALRPIGRTASRWRVVRCTGSVSNCRQNVRVPNGSIVSNATSRGIVRRQEPEDDLVHARVRERRTPTTTSSGVP